MSKFQWEAKEICFQHTSDEIRKYNLNFYLISGNEMSDYTQSDVRLYLISDYTQVGDQQGGHLSLPLYSY